MTAAGQGATAVYAALARGTDLSEAAVAEGVAGRVCRIKDETGGAAAERMARQLVSAWHESLARRSEQVAHPPKRGGAETPGEGWVRGAQSQPGDGAPSDGRAQPQSDGAGARLGVIFASAKGAIEDSVWTATAEELARDSLAPVLERFLELTGVVPARALCISNACSSTHVALELAARWLAVGAADEVLVLAADHVGPFVLKGFASLKSLAPERVTPFGDGRQGIQLGEAAVAIRLGRDRGVARIAGAATAVEGYALTRSHEDGACLAAVCRAACGPEAPDLVIAHGTGTMANDAMEDRVYTRLFQDRTPITCTKWSLGHCLGASGAVDVMAALGALAHGTFGIGATPRLDPSMTARYILRTDAEAAAVPPYGRPHPRRVLIASAGFGGMHGALVLERA